MIDLNGAFTALVTPFNDNARYLDLDALKRNIHHQAEAGISGLLPCGTTGETPTLSSDEYRQVILTTIDTAKPLGLTVIAGAGSHNTALAVQRHRFVHEAGAHAALHVTPYYNKPSQEGLYRHFSTIADASPLPVVLYNIPARTAVALSLDTIERLARHPNICALKEASGSVDFAAQVVARTDLTLLSGDDPLTLPLASVGGRGVISVLANLLPEHVAALCNAFLTDDWAAARIINDSLLPLARALLTLDTNPVPVKTAMRLLGRDSGALRLPLCPAEVTVAQQLSELLGAYDLKLAQALA